MRFSDTEVKDLLLAWVLVSVAFALAIRQTSSLLTNIWVAAITVGIGFIGHEVAHKLTAQHYHKFAEFKANLPMLVVMLIISLLGVVIAAPGAVVISGFVNRRENGIISLAGPLTNFALAVVFLGLFYVMPTGIPSVIAAFGFLINTWLGLFNLIPFGIFDGAKIINWDKKVYGGMVLLGVILLLFSQVLQSL